MIDSLNNFLSFILLFWEEVPPAPATTIVKTELLLKYY